MIPKFLIVIEKGIIKEIYSTVEMEYAIIHIDQKNPVEGAWSSVETDLDIKSISYLLRPINQRNPRHFKKAILSLIRLSF